MPQQMCMDTKGMVYWLKSFPSLCALGNHVTNKQTSNCVLNNLSSEENNPAKILSVILFRFLTEVVKNC